jgi:hypothetical protein
MTLEEFTRRKNRKEIPDSEKVEIEKHFETLFKKGEPLRKIKEMEDFVSHIVTLKDFLIKNGLEEGVLRIEIGSEKNEQNKKDNLCLNLLENGHTLISTNYINI